VLPHTFLLVTSGDRACEVSKHDSWMAAVFTIRGEKNVGRLDVEMVNRVPSVIRHEVTLMPSINYAKVQEC
jgi:hypothetical protein